MGLTGLAQFLAGLKSADTQIQETKRNLEQLTVAALAARAALGDLKVDTGAIAEFTAAIVTMKKELTSLDESAKTTKACVRDVKMTASQGAETVTVAEVQKRALKSLEDQAIRTAAAEGLVGLAGSNNNYAVLDIAEQRNAAQLRNIVNSGLRQQYTQAEAQRLVDQMLSEPGISGVDQRLVSDAAARRNASELLRTQMQRTFFQPGSTVGAYEGMGQRDVERVGGAIPLGAPGSVSNLRAERAMIANARQLARIEELRGIRADVLPEDMDALRRLEQHLPREPRESSLLRLLSGGALGGGTGHAGGADGINRGALFGLLPGGARGSQAAVTSLLGIAGAAAVGAGPGVAGLGVAAAAAVPTLVGALGTLKLAFADITAAAFTTQKAFNALTPTQQAFVQSLRSLDAGLIKGLEATAAQTLLPQLTKALHLAFTPSAVGSLQGGVGAFAGALGGGAQQFGRMFGSAGFQDQFGKMLQQDAGYLRMFLDGITHLTDAFVRLNVSAAPFLHWLGTATTNMAKWVDQSIRADQVNGRLAHFFDMAKQSLQALGGLFASVGHLARGFADAVGFQNSIKLINLLRAAVNEVAYVLKVNAPVTRAFFSGALAAAKDLLTVVHLLAQSITPILRGINELVQATAGWRYTIDALLAIVTLRWVLGWNLLRLTALRAILFIDANIYAGLIPAVDAATVATMGLGTAFLRILGPIGLVIAAGMTLSAIFDKNNYTAQQFLSDKALQKRFIGTFGEAAFKEEMKKMKAAGETAGAPGVTIPTAGQTSNPYSYPLNVAPVLSALGGDAMNAPSAFGTPSPLLGTGKAGVLPTRMENAILQAQANNSVSGQRTAINNALAWISSHIGQVKDQTVKGQYLQEQIALQSQLSSLSTTQTSNVLGTRSAAISAARQALSTGAGGTPAQEGAAARVATDFAQAQLHALEAMKAHAKTVAEGNRIQNVINSVTSLLAQAHKDTLDAVRRGLRLQLSQQTAMMSTAFGTFRSVTGTGATPGQEVSGSADFIAFAGREMQRLQLLKKDAKTAEDRLAVQREINRLNDEILAANKKLGKGLQDQADLARTTAIERTLGLNPRDPRGAVAAARETQQVRHFLTQQLQAHGLAGAGSLQGDVQLLYRNHDISKRQYESLEKILKAITEMKGITGTVSSAITGNISQRLQQIRDALRQQSHPTTFHVPSIAEITRGLKGGTAADRKIIADRIAEAQIFGGKIPTGTDVFGYPTAMGTSGPRYHVPGQVSGEGHVNIHGDVNINLGGMGGQNAAQIAKEIRNELLKTSRRNPTQTRGPQAGRKLGLT